MLQIAKSIAICNFLLYNLQNRKMAFTLSNIGFFPIQQFLKNQKQRRERMKRRNAKTLGAVHTHTHTHIMFIKR